MRSRFRRQIAARTNFLPAAGFTELILSNTDLSPRRGPAVARQQTRTIGLSERGVMESLRKTNGQGRSRTIVRAVAAIGCAAVLFAAVLDARAAPVGSGKKEDGFQSSVPAAILL